MSEQPVKSDQPHRKKKYQTRTIKLNAQNYDRNDPIKEYLIGLLGFLIR